MQGFSIMPHIFADTFYRKLIAWNFFDSKKSNLNDSIVFECR